MLMVIAAVAPMGAIVGSVPLSYAFGTGVGTPATFLIAGVILFCFAVGYAAMGRHIVSHGGFYAYISQAWARIPAVGGASIAVLSYNVLTVGLIAGFGYFSKRVFENRQVRASRLVMVVIMARWTMASWWAGLVS